MGSAPACEPGRIAAGQVARVWRAPRRTAEDVEDVRREVQIMHHLEGHANIVKIFGAYEDKHSVHLARAPAPPPPPPQHGTPSCLHARRKERGAPASAPAGQASV